MEMQEKTVFLIDGEMGAGKTHFVKSLVPEATSPTFTIINQYRENIYHLDLYRLEREEEFYHLGLEEILNGDNIVFIEWAEKLPPVWRDMISGLIVRVKICKLEDGRREVTVSRHS